MRKLRKYSTEDLFISSLQDRQSEKRGLPNFISKISDSGKVFAEKFPPSPIASYRCYDKTNEDPDRDLLKDLTGNGYDIRLSNFSFTLGSGYGKFNQNFNTWRFSETSGEFSQGRFTVTGTTNSDKRFRFSKDFQIGDKITMKLKISGIPSEITDFQLLNESYDVNVVIPLSNGINYIDTEIGDVGTYKTIYFIGTVPDEINNNFEITVEQIPEYKGALINDGVDDKGICVKPYGNVGTVISVVKEIKWSEGSYFFDTNNSSDIGRIYCWKSASGISCGVPYTPISSIEDNIFISFRRDPVESTIPITIFMGRAAGVIIALYAMEVYRKKLSDKELEEAKDRLRKEYIEKTGQSIYPEGIVASYETYDKTNEDSGRDTLEDLSGNGHNIKLNNFSWSLGSGYGKYILMEFNKSLGFIDKSNVKSITKTTIEIAPYKIDNNAITGGDYYYIDKISSNVTLECSGIREDKPVFIVPYNRPYTEGESMKIQLKNGINKLYLDYNNLPDPSYPYVKFVCEGNSYDYSENEYIIIKQIPEYKGALVSDGVDDYGVCSNFPTLAKEKGYTVIALREWISIKNQSCLVSKESDDSTKGEFTVEFTIPTKSSLAYSYGSTKGITINSNLLVTYQSSVKYNDFSLNKGTREPSEDLLLFKKRLNTVLCSNVALYALEIYDRDLTDSEIEEVKERMIKRYEEKTGETYDRTESLVAKYETYDKTNEDSGRDTLEDLSGNGHNIKLNNFSWSLNSGYGKFSTDNFEYNPNNNLVGGVWHKITSTIVKGKPKVSVAGQGYWNIGYKSGKNIISFTLKVDGVLEDNKFYVHQYVSGYGKFELKNGINRVTLDLTDSPKKDYQFASFSSEKGDYTTDITIEIIPEYKGALVSDGVDDYGVCKNFPLIPNSSGYTICAIRKWIDFPLTKVCGLISKRTAVGVGEDGSGEFCFEKYGSPSLPNVVYSYGKHSEINISNDEVFSYMTSKSYNGSSIISGNSNGTDFFLLFAGLSNDGGVTVSEYSRAAIYAVEIYNRDLTEDEIKKVKIRMLNRFNEKTGGN